MGGRPLDAAEGGRSEDNAQRSGPGESGGAAVHAELGVDVFKMFLHGRRSHHQLAGNLAIGETGSDQPQHFCFSLGQRLIASRGEHCAGCS